MKNFTAHYVRFSGSTEWSCDPRQRDRGEAATACREFKTHGTTHPVCSFRRQRGPRWRLATPTSPSCPSGAPNSTAPTPRSAPTRSQPNGSPKPAPTVYHERTGDEIPVAPTIPVGIAAEHRSFDGTLWVSPDTFRAYVRETVASLAHHGFDRVVIVNGHGGNSNALREVTGTISREDAAYAVAFTWFESIDTEAEMGHGGPVETSLLHAVDDGLVRADELDAAAAGASEGWGEWVAGVNLAHDSDEFTDSGVVGDPREATADLGERLLDRSGEALADVLAAVGSREV
ncbi:MAG: uncharacterized protein, putative amidase [uncultured archaeon A07HN63]|nr:MAG: uncharacterized protein, putative amidase [uncultured archaeon A07HN63]